MRCNKISEMPSYAQPTIGCPQPSAAVFVKNWNRADYDRACVHAFIDGNTGDVHQS